MFANDSLFSNSKFMINTKLYISTIDLRRLR